MLFALKWSMVNVENNIFKIWPHVFTCHECTQCHDRQIVYIPMLESLWIILYRPVHDLGIQGMKVARTNWLPCLVDQYQLSVCLKWVIQCMFTNKCPLISSTTCQYSTFQAFIWRDLNRKVLVHLNYSNCCLEEVESQHHLCGWLDWLRSSLFANLALATILLLLALTPSDFNWESLFLAEDMIQNFLFVFGNHFKNDCQITKFVEAHTKMIEWF